MYGWQRGTSLRITVLLYSIGEKVHRSSSADTYTENQLDVWPLFVRIGLCIYALKTIKSLAQTITDGCPNICIVVATLSIIHPTPIFLPGYSIASVGQATMGFFLRFPKLSGRKYRAFLGESLIRNRWIEYLFIDG